MTTTTATSWNVDDINAGTTALQNLVGYTSGTNTRVENFIVGTRAFVYCTRFP